MPDWLLLTVATITWIVNLVFVLLAVINVALRSPENLFHGVGIGLVLALTLMLGGWVMFQRWQTGHVTGFLNFAGMTVGLLWALPAAIGIFVNPDGLFLSAIPFFFGISVIAICLKSDVSQNG
ncbi:MAG: hypothetical protein ACU0GG_19505 [Paracoccaceae bacterium]